MSLTHESTPVRCGCGAPLLVDEAANGQTQCDACRGDPDRLRSCQVCHEVAHHQRVREGLCCEQRRR